MDRAMLCDHLAQAEEHVAQNDRHITRQREIIEEIRGRGHDTYIAEDLLRQFLEMQILHVADRDRLRAQLAE